MHIKGWYFLVDRVKFNSTEDYMVTFSNVKNNKEINYLIESSQKQ